MTIQETIDAANDELTRYIDDRGVYDAELGEEFPEPAYNREFGRILGFGQGMERAKKIITAMIDDYLGEVEKEHRKVSRGIGCNDHEKSEYGEHLAGAIDGLTAFRKKLG